MDFKLSEEQVKKIEEWDDALNGHKCNARIEVSLIDDRAWKHTGTIGGHLQYMFTPNSIGQSQKVKCLCCGEILDVTDYDLW